MKIYLLFIALVFSPPFYSQMIGINTDNPVAMIDVKATSSDSTDKVMRVVNSAGKEIFTVLNNGNIGIGVSKPKVRLDVRSIDGASEIGIGNTDIDPSVVGPGAIRYVSSLNQLHYSTGSDWFRFTSSLERPYLIAKDNTVAGNYPDSTITPLGGFEVVKDSYNSFNADSTIFRVPMESIYVFSFTVAFKEDSVMPNSYIEASWITSIGDTIKSVRYFPVGAKGVASITCYGAMRFKVGDTLRPLIYHTLGGRRELLVSSGSGSNSSTDFNNIFIFAL